MVLVKRYLCISQVALAGLLICCSLILPSVVTTEGGVSNFGNHASTVIPYVAAFALSIYFLCRAAGELHKVSPALSAMAVSLAVLAVLDLL
jgi:hypothetical protein